MVASRGFRDQGHAPELFTCYELDLAAARQALTAQPGQVGALIYTGSQWVGLDLLAGPGLFGGAWPRLRALCGRRYWPGAQSLVPAGRRGRPLHADQGRGCPPPAVGLGEEYHLTIPELAGATLVAQGRMAHLTAFPAAEAPEAPEVNQ